MGEHWKIERKYRRILNKKIAGKVRTQEWLITSQARGCNFDLVQFRRLGC